MLRCKAMGLGGLGAAVVVVRVCRERVEGLVAEEGKGGVGDDDGGGDDDEGEDLV